MLGGVTLGAGSCNSTTGPKLGVSGGTIHPILVSQRNVPCLRPSQKQPILNSPYAYPGRHWELENSLPTDRIVEQRRQSEYIVPVPPSRRESTQRALPLGIAELSDERQQYDPSPIINEIRRRVDTWRQIPNPRNWGVTAETARLLQHWRSFDFPNPAPLLLPNRSSRGPSSG